MPIQGLKELYIDELKDLYSAESQLVKALPKMAKAAADFGATVLMSNHTEFDNGYFRAHTAANRRPGEANPYDVGKEAVARYFTVVQDCTLAAKIRATGK